MIGADRFCNYCGAELELKRQRMGQLIVTQLVCWFCRRTTPTLECDTDTNVHRELLLSPDEEATPQENTWLPKSLRHRRLQSSPAIPGKPYVVLGYEAGWMRVKAGKREAWVAPGGRLLLEALEDEDG